jgi:hypothetical protein
MVLDLLVGFQPVIQFTTWFVSSVLEELIRSDTNELRDALDRTARVAGVVHTFKILWLLMSGPIVVSPFCSHIQKAKHSQPPSNRPRDPRIH